MRSEPRGLLLSRESESLGISATLSSTTITRRVVDYSWDRPTTLEDDWNFMSRNQRWGYQDPMQPAEQQPLARFLGHVTSRGRSVAFFFLVVGDILLNALCGVITVAVGADINDSPILKQDLWMGALGGALKTMALDLPPMWWSFMGVRWNIFLWLAGIFASVVGTTATVSIIRLGTVRNELLRAAAASALLVSRTAIMEKGVFLAHFPQGDMVSNTIAAIVFVKVSKDRGLFICSYGVAATAGATYSLAYGFVTTFLRRFFLTVNFVLFEGEPQVQHSH